MGHFSGTKKKKEQGPSSITQCENKEIPLLKLPLQSSWVMTPLNTDNSVPKLQNLVFYIKSEYGLEEHPPHWKRPTILAAAFYVWTGINTDGQKAGGCRHTRSSNITSNCPSQANAASPSPALGCGGWWCAEPNNREMTQENISTHFCLGSYEKKPRTSVSIWHFLFKGRF